MNRCWASCWGGWLAILILAGWPLSTNAQFVSGDWLERSEARVQEHRTTSVSFLVLDAQGKLAPNAKVHIQQLEHAFTLGFMVHGAFPEAYEAQAEGWRAFNAVSLEPMTTWRQVQPNGPGLFAHEAVDGVIESAQATGLRVRWGALVSADPFDLPEWVVPLRGEALFEAMRNYSDQVASAYGQALSDLDLAEETIDHERLSPAMIRLLAHDWQAVQGNLSPKLRYENALVGSKAFAVLQNMDSVVKQRLGIKGFTIDQAFPPRPIAQDLLEPALQRITRFDQPVTIGLLEIGGSHGIETTVNTETVIRTLFADPLVTGLYFSGLTTDQVVEPSAALFDEQGEPTTISRTLDQLFRETWWTDTTVTTNPLGKAEARVFKGTHQVTATLPDGSSVTVKLVLDDQYDKAEPREIVLMPVADVADE